MGAEITRLKRQVSSLTKENEELKKKKRVDGSQKKEKAATASAEVVLTSGGVVQTELKQLYEARIADCKNETNRALSQVCDLHSLYI